MSKVFALTVVGGQIKALKGEIDTIQNVTITEDKWGKQRGLEFSGNSYIKLVDDELRNFGADVDFTFSSWYKYGAMKNCGWQALIAHPSDYTSICVCEEYQPTPYVFSVGKSSSNNVVCRYGKSISTTDWHHFAVVRRSGIITLYIDGVAGPKYDTSKNSFDLTNMYVGWDGRQSNAWNDGVISDLVMFRDEVLWTEDFTPPKAPLLGTHLYLDANNAVWGCKS